MEWTVTRLDDDMFSYGRPVKVRQWRAHVRADNYEDALVAGADALGTTVDNVEAVEADGGVGVNMKWDSVRGSRGKE